MQKIYRLLKVDEELERLGALDVVPAYSSIAVFFDAPPAKGAIERTEYVIDNIDTLSLESSTPLFREHRIVVDYDGVDLDRVASYAGIDVDEVINLHLKSEYTVAMIGFLPHFPYLIGLDKRIATPRLEEPRKAVPAGSVAIGGSQTGIYPAVSPGGWNIIGRTCTDYLAEIRPGDRIMFEETHST